MTKKSQDFILPVSNTLALPFPILFLKGQIDEDKDRVENPKNFDWPCYAIGEIGDVFGLF